MRAAPTPADPEKETSLVTRVKELAGTEIKRKIFKTITKNDLRGVPENPNRAECSPRRTPKELQSRPRDPGRLPEARKTSEELPGVPFGMFPGHPGPWRT